MAKRQTRRALSIKGLTYQWIKDYCDQEERSVAGFVEEIVKEKMTELGIPKPTILMPRPEAPKVHKTPEPEEIPPAHFTF